MKNEKVRTTKRPPQGEIPCGGLWFLCGRGRKTDVLFPDAVAVVSVMRYECRYGRLFHFSRMLSSTACLIWIAVV